MLAIAIPAMMVLRCRGGALFALFPRPLRGHRDGRLRVTNAVVTGNGSADQPFSAGISASNNSSAIISGTTISITVGPGIDVQAGGMARISGTTVTGGTGAPVLVRAGGIVELLAGNGIAGVSCDATSVLFGSGSSVPTDCKKVK